MSIAVVPPLVENSALAAALNRQRLDEHNVTLINLLGGAGCGKTALLERVIPLLLHELRVAVIAGDPSTTLDSQRIAALGVPVVQLLTRDACHLTGSQVEHALDRLPLEDIDLLIVENVGNPVCPAASDLGEHFRVAVLSMPEGDDKPAKYPLLFRDANAVVISKCDLAPFVPFRTGTAIAALRHLCPSAPIFETDALSLRGMDELHDWIRLTAHERAREPVPSEPLAGMWLG